MMETTKTFILLDLETSGLPRGDSNSCKITEIALVAVNRQNIIDANLGVSKENNEEHSVLPRVLNKLNIPVYPCTVIQPMASEISGLTNEGLEHQNPFDDKLYEIISNFIQRLEKPICMVAHNGNRFDFPLLQSELSKINKILPEDMFCADSLPGFRQVLVDAQNVGNDTSSNILLGIKPIDGEVNYDPCKTLPKCGWSNNDYDNELAQAVDLAEKLTGDQSPFNVDDLERKIKLEMERIRKVNEHTPGRPRNRKPISDKSTYRFGNINPTEEISVRRKLVKDLQPKRKFNLSSLYQSLTRKELVNAHQAEGDCLALLECIAVVGKPILDWIDINKIPFRSIKKMW